MGVAAQKLQCSFVFQNKRKTNLGIGFASVEESALGWLPVGFGLTEGVI